MAYNKETGMYEGWIYKITNTVNDKCYIGQTSTSIQRRWSQHLNPKNHGNALYSAMDKYGRDKFKIEKIEFVEAKEKKDLKQLLNQKEKYYISKFQSRGSKGYNMTPGGESRPDYVCKEVFCFKVNGEYVGRYASMTDASNALDIAITNIHEAMNRKGTTHGYYFNSKNIFDYVPLSGVKVGVDVYDYSTSEFIGSFESITSAMNYVGLDNKRASHIKRCMDGKTKHAYGYIWRYPGEAIDSRKCIKSLSVMKPVNVYTIDNEFVGTYPSGMYVAREFNTFRSSIGACLSNKQESANGHKYYYANDLNQPDKTKITSMTALEVIETYGYAV